MKKRGILIGSVCVFLLCASAASALQRRAAQPVKFEKISERLYEIPGGRGATGGAYIGENGVLLIDTKMDKQSMDQVMAETKKHTSSGRLNQLEELVQKAGIRLRSDENPSPAQKQTPNVSVSRKSSVEATDEEIFSEAMNGVERASWKHLPHPSSNPVRKPDRDPAAEDRKPGRTRSGTG